MATTTKTTDDPRIAKILEAQVYGIYHESELIYVGQTRGPLSRRLDYHRNLANRASNSSDIHRYIREEVDDPRADLTIEELSYANEHIAILSEDTLNEQAGSHTPRMYEGYRWSTPELDYLEDHSLRKAGEVLDASYNQCRRAKLKLGWIEERRVEEWTDAEDALLGTDTDAAIADKIDRTQAAVTARRTKLGIEAHGKRQLNDGEAIQLYFEYHLTSATQKEVGDRWGVSQKTVSAITRREASAYSHIDWDDIDDTIEELGEGIELTLDDMPSTEAYEPRAYAHTYA